MSESDPTHSTTLETISIAELSAELELPIVIGQVFTTLLLSEEVLIALVQGGIINNEQFESMLARASAEIEQTCKQMEENLRPGGKYSAADIAVISKTANSIFARIRTRLKASP
jgi:hypothetical protein